jgi:hypothetical protein
MRIRNEIGIPLNEKPTITNIHYSNISSLVRAEVAKLLYSAMGVDLTDGITIARETITWVIGRYVSAPQGMVNKFSDKAEYTIAEINTIFETSYYEAKKPWMQAKDLLMCICLRMNNYDLKSVDVSKLIDKLIEMQANMSSHERVSMYTVMTLVRTALERLLEKQPMRTLQVNMAKLRSLNKPMQTAYSEFINMIFWISVIIIFVLSFFVFHFIYNLARDITTVLISAIVIIVFTISALYSWFIGNVK